jgi:hypothetical protein
MIKYKNPFEREVAIWKKIRIHANVAVKDLLLKNGHQSRGSRDFPHPSSLRRTAKYASLLRIQGALHLALFEQPGKDDLFTSLLRTKC